MAKSKRAGAPRTAAGSYIADMLAEAAKRRKEADEATTDDDRLWYLGRAAFFEECAQEAKVKEERAQPVAAE